MSKLIRLSVTLACIFYLIAILFVPQINAETNYYSNNFESTSALDDGYWSLHDAEVQKMEYSNVLKVDGEATFMPQHGNYAMDNFSIQFDVWHDVRYENNTAYSGPFYQCTDSENNPVMTMGYVQRGTNDVLTQQGSLEFNSGSQHYYFPFDHASEWSTWRLTATITNIDGHYFANVTVQINTETVTAFVNDFEQTVSTITNEPIINPVAFHNLLPLPQPGAPVPTYTPTHYSLSGIHFDPMSNNQAKPIANNNGATPSYIDNFYYGYADTVPPSSHPTTNTGPESPQTEPFPTTLAAALVLSVVLIVIGVLVYLKKRK